MMPGTSQPSPRVLPPPPSLSPSHSGRRQARRFIPPPGPRGKREILRDEGILYRYLELHTESAAAVGTDAQRGAIRCACARDASCTFFRSAADNLDVGGGPFPKFGTGFARKVRGFTSFSKRRFWAASRFRSAASASRFMSPSKGPGAARARRFARNLRNSSSASSARTLFRSDRRARRRSAARRAASWYNAAAPRPSAFTVAFARRH